MSNDSSATAAFADLGLPPALLNPLNRLGYREATPIQARTIPLLLSGRDVVGIAQTGTGKTAAFALPVLASLATDQRHVQALVLCPTRELSLQVAEAFRSYAADMDGLKVLTVCGGTDMRQQLRALKEGVQVVVATPGRLLDHLQRGSIDLSQVQTVVLDEADEMLRMGFIDDVDTILARTPDQSRVALFSATMPPRIRQIAERHLNNPEEVAITAASSTNANIEQAVWWVKGASKVEALDRLLAYEQRDAVIVFTRTRESSASVAEQLTRSGYRAAALHGDMDQKQRVRTVDQLKNGSLDVLVATDVAARGLDVERITHVINFDIPFDEEAYVHRIGRTGRAGRQGKAILFVTPRDRRMLRNIERATGNVLTEISLPTRAMVALKQLDEFAGSIRARTESAAQPELSALIDQLAQGSNEQVDGDYRSLAVALASMLADAQGLDFSARDKRRNESDKSTARENSREKSDARSSRQQGDEHKPSKRSKSARVLKDHPDIAMECFRIAVGKRHGVEPREIVGAIANEAGIEGRYIGAINIEREFSTVELPEGMPKPILKHLRKTRVRGVSLQMERVA